MTWPFGRTLRTSDPWDRIRLYGICKTEGWGALACKGGHRFRRYRRLWPRRGKLRRWATLRRNSRLFFQRGGPAARTCYVWVWTQTTHLAAARFHLLHPRSYLVGNFNEFTNRVQETNGPIREGSAGSFSGLRIEIARACFHVWGKWWVRTSALKIGRGRTPFFWEGASMAYSVYRSGPEPCWHWDTRCLFEPRQGSLTGFRWQGLISKISSTRQSSS